MKRTIVLGLVFTLFLSACMAVSPQTENGDDQLVTIYALAD
jgi:hypothetical protein